ncbi:cytochrome c oxidase assembly protein [Hyphomicrobium sp. 99]|uniref:cytochrome c oxidase assembly protein n=1 Tax=Hyphomicrobium sp. 99 TaxID=1163419 RepID=UPI0005F87E14|nr:cytochrome c oxidase assembly protein [Hyphomicrobium sp. 99]
MKEDHTVHRDDDGAAKAVRQNRRAVFGCLAALAVMGSITAASPTLYSMFCKATGYAGTVQRAENNNAGKVLDRTLTVRFDSNVAPGLPWTFEPDVSKMEVKIGETTMAFFRATNNSDKPVKGQAIFNVTPEAFGSYFNKIECFCFKEQTLQPHQTVEMPVTFFLDPKLVEDSSTALQPEVTLSYSFFPAVPKAATAEVTPPQPKAGG